MRKKFYQGGIYLVVIAMVFGLLGLMPLKSAASGQPARKIVVFKSGILNDSAKESLIKNFGAVKIKDLKLINGMAVYLPPNAEAALENMNGVARVDDDVIVEALAKPAPSQPAEVLPWGIDRIDAEQVWSITCADPIKVGIIDTGIDIIHPDLKDNVKGGRNTIDPLKSYNDDNGHGTHVAGIVAAIDNNIGVVGVGPKIDLYAVKVLNRQGSGYLSDVIEGLEWAIANRMQVINMSLGTNINVQSFRDAVSLVNAAGIVQVAAAGNNSGGAVTYPAAYPEVIAVSATDKNDQFASFSSKGPEIDIAAPGASIYSTYKGSTYATLSGTSMAAPHVAGTAALVLSINPGLTPAEVQQILQNTAEDRGAPGWDEYFGYGLVDAFTAVASPTP